MSKKYATNSVEYNKNYYDTKKNAIIEKYYKTLVKCPFCEREVLKQNLLKHQQTALCHRKQANIVALNERLKQLL
jgi:uncharacterized protein (DUF2225 family)